VERGGREEEACHPPGEHVTPHELFEHNMDGKALHQYAYHSGHSYSFQTPNTSLVLFGDVVFWAP